MTLALLLCCLLAGHALSPMSQAADTPALTGQSLSLQAGQITLDLSTLGPSVRTVWIALETGALPLGTVITLSSRGTSWQQTLTAFGARSDADGLRYQVAVPRGLATDTLVLSIQIGQAEGGAGRPATPTDVVGITVLPAQ